MTARQVWEGLLTELNKVNAPSMLLQDFNYFFNKAIYQYINKRYNIYDINQQTSDDLRVLKATSILPVTKSLETDQFEELNNLGAGSSKLFGATYEVTLPQDYLHILNCICIYKVNKNYKCYNAGDYVQFAAKRLTGDSWPIIVNDYFNRPLPERPYFYINNVNTSTSIPTNPYNPELSGSTDLNKKYNVGNSVTEYYLIKDSTDEEPVKAGTKVYVKNGELYKESSFSTKLSGVTLNDTAQKQVPGESNDSNLPRTLSLSSLGFEETSTVEKDIAVRYGNASTVRMEIRYGHDDSLFTLEKVFVDYIKTPQFIRLTQEQVNLTEDTSQIMEFPDYVCQEIINELTMLVMANISDPRLQSNAIVTQSIANPAQQQAQSQPNR